MNVEERAKAEDHIEIGKFCLYLPLMAMWIFAPLMAWQSAVDRLQHHLQVPGAIIESVSIVYCRHTE